MEQILNILKEHQTTIAILSGLSFAAFLLSLLSLPWMICRIPEDYFLGSYSREQEHRPMIIRIVTRGVKNLLGAGLFLVGLVMIFIPGQGLLTMCLGLVVMDFPGKNKLLKKLVGMEKVRISLNWIRGKKKVTPLRFPPS